LLDKIRPFYVEAKKDTRENKFTTKKKILYIKKINSIIKAYIDENMDRFSGLIKEFGKLNAGAKLNASVEFNNYYYDPTEDIDEDSNPGDYSYLSFYEFLSEHRSITSLDTKLIEEYASTLVHKRMEAIVLREIVANFNGGDFSAYLSNIIEGILHQNLMRNFEKQVQEEMNSLASLKDRLGEDKFKAYVVDRVNKKIEQDKAVMNVYIKRFIKKDLTEKIGENFELFPLERIKSESLKIIEECDRIVSEITPKYTVEKKEFTEYKKVYDVETPIFEELIKMWTKLNPIFEYANRTETSPQTGSGSGEEENLTD